MQQLDEIHAVDATWREDGKAKEEVAKPLTAPTVCALSARSNSASRQLFDRRYAERIALFVNHALVFQVLSIVSRLAICSLFQVLG